MHTGKGDSLATGTKGEGGRGLAVGSGSQKWNLDIVAPTSASELERETEASAPALCETVAHVEPGATSTVRVKVNGVELEMSVEEALRRGSEALWRNNGELAAELRALRAKVASLRIALDEEGHISTAVRKRLVGGGVSAHWRMGTALAVGPRRDTEAEALWDCSIAAGEMARGRMPTSSEVEALVVGLHEMARGGWKDEVCPRTEEAERGHVSSESVKTSDGPSVGDRAAEVHPGWAGALDDARTEACADGWMALGAGAPGMAAVVALGARFAVMLEGAEGRSLDDDADLQSVAIHIARQWLAQGAAVDAREVVAEIDAECMRVDRGRGSVSFQTFVKLCTAARGLSGYGVAS